MSSTWSAAHRRGNGGREHMVLGRNYHGSQKGWLEKLVALRMTWLPRVGRPASPIARQSPIARLSPPPPTNHPHRAAKAAASGPGKLYSVSVLGAGHDGVI